MKRRAERLWIAVLALSCLAAALAVPAAAKKEGGGGSSGPQTPLAGRLDQGFGNAGKAMIAFPAESAGDVGVKYDLPFQFAPGHLEMATAPSGKIVVAGNTKLVRLTAAGKLDRSFGGGAIGVARPPGQTLLLADAAVDSRGRTLLAGSARPLPAGSVPDPLIGSAVVMRFATNGSLDSDFGNGGVLITDFGIKPPSIGSNQYKAAAVGLRSLAVDSLDRPVLSGGSVTKVISCFGKETARSTAFVARLTENGALDPSFGAGGLRQIADFGSFEQGSLLPGGTLVAIGNGQPMCSGEGGGPPVVLNGFGSEGSLSPNFGFAGFRTVGYKSAPVMAIAPSGKILLLGAKNKKTQLIMRLLPNGTADPGFGRTGRITVLPPKHAAFAALAADGRGRLLLTGRITKRIKLSGLTRSSFLLGRLNPKGSVDRSFGRRGTVTTGFGGPSSAFATQVVLDAKGRILVGGGVSTPRLNTGGGFALARYLNEPTKGR